MVQLANPIALLASAAVIIPVLIHLWNVRKGKTLKVGSIALLAESSKQAARSRRITNWPLFLLRCLLLLLLALLLAKPLWQVDKSNIKGWLLVAGDELATAYQQHTKRIDSLMTEGFEIHNLSPSFQPLTLQDTALYPQKEFPSETLIWPALKYLDAGLPANFNLYVFSTGRLKDFKGERPSSNLDIHWINLEPGSKESKDPAYSFVTASKKINTFQWVSTGNGNYYEPDSSVLLQPDTTPVRIGIFAGKNNSDAHYLQAAIEAISQYTGKDIQITRELSAQPQQLIFWLQEAEPSKDLLSSLTTTGTLFQYDKGTVTPIFLPFINHVVDINNNRKETFYRYAAGTAIGNTIWSLADGRPLLSTEDNNGRTIIHFKGRFNPQWTDMIWQESFVRSLLPFVLNAPAINADDIRKIDQLQAIQRSAVTKENGTTTNLILENKKDLSFLIWMIILLVFAAERFLAHHQNKPKDA